MKNAKSATIRKEPRDNLIPAVKSSRQGVGSEDAETIYSSGIDLTLKTRSAGFFQQDNRVEFSGSLIDGVDILRIEEALDRFPWAKEYYGSAFRSLGREYPLDTEGGYFIRVKQDTVIQLPIQACLFLKRQGFRQKVHNVVIVEEGARVYLVTGCSASESADESFHLGISEFFIKKGGYLNFTMVHSWKDDTTVEPVSIALLDEAAEFVSNYVCLRPVKDIRMFPTAVLRDKQSKVSFNSLLLSHPGSQQDIGSRAILKAENTRAEIVSRAVSLGGKIIVRGHLKAENKEIKAHLECRGLILSEKGAIHAIPEMESDFRDVQMSHEAAIGRINKDEIEYLCSRGFSEEQAQAVIVRGFMDVDVLGLPKALKEEISRIEHNSLKDSF